MKENTESAPFLTEEDAERKLFATLKYEVGNLLHEKFIAYNEGKFHTGIELNPATHAITELFYRKINAAAEKANKRIEELQKERDELLSKKIQSDDCDINENYLDGFFGGNGDIYLTVASKNDDGLFTSACVRIATSGGKAPTEVKIAAANLVRVLEQF